MFDALISNGMIDSLPLIVQVGKNCLYRVNKDPTDDDKDVYIVTEFDGYKRGCWNIKLYYHEAIRWIQDNCSELNKGSPLKEIQDAINNIYNTRYSKFIYRYDWVLLCKHDDGRYFLCPGDYVTDNSNDIEFKSENKSSYPCKILDKEAAIKWLRECYQDEIRERDEAIQEIERD